MSATQDWLEEASRHLAVQALDREAVIRFMNDVVNGRTAKVGDSQQAAILLVALLQGVHFGDDIGQEFRRLMGVRKLRSKLFDPKNCPMDTPAWGVVEHYVRGRISHGEAVRLFQDEVCPASERQIESWIATMKPRVERTLAELGYFEVVAQDTEKKQG